MCKAGFKDGKIALSFVVPAICLTRNIRDCKPSLLAASVDQYDHGAVHHQPLDTGQQLIHRKAGIHLER
jgi:hypothetical protein